MRLLRLGAIVLACVPTTAVAVAQEAEFEPVDNPFQRGYSYQIGADLAPNVDIGGLRWTLVRLTPNQRGEIDPDREATVTAELEFENLGDASVDVLVVVLLEDDRGGPLERLAFKSFRAGGGRFKAVRERFKVPGRSLLAAAGVYLFCEIEE